MATGFAISTEELSALGELVIRTTPIIVIYSVDQTNPFPNARGHINALYTSSKSFVLSNQSHPSPYRSDRYYLSIYSDRLRSDCYLLGGVDGGI